MMPTALISYVTVDPYSAELGGVEVGFYLTYPRSHDWHLGYALSTQVARISEDGWR